MKSKTQNSKLKTILKSQTRKTFGFLHLNLFGSWNLVLGICSNRLTRVFGFILTFGFLAVISLMVIPVAAEAATVQFSPSSTTVGLGETVEVQVQVATATAVTAVEVVVNFPADKLLGIQATSSNTVFPISVFPGQVNNANGTVKFTVSVPSPGYFGTGGTIGTIIFRGTQLGTATLTVASAHIVEGSSGDEKYNGSSPGTILIDSSVKPKYTVTGEKGPVPIVNSTSHPDPSKWYSNRNVSFTWTGGVEYNYVFDQNPDTLPPTASKGTATTTTVSGVGDGVWYFHVRATNGDGLWGPTSTFKVNIDGTNPASFQLILDPDDDPSALPLITFDVTDATSGIDHYELSLDDGTYVTVPSPYQLPQVKPGKHTVTVKAFDRAGNIATASVTMDIVRLTPTPKIESPGNDYTMALGGGAKLTGTGPKNATIQLFANDQFITSVKSDKDGKWEIKLVDQPEAGEYTLKVKAVLPQHLDSEYSNEIKGKIEAAGFSFGGVNLGGLKIGAFAIPSWALLIMYVVFLLLLLALLAYLFYRWQKARKAQKLALQKLELMTSADPAASPIPTNVGQGTVTPEAGAATPNQPPQPAPGQAPTEPAK